MPKGEYWLENLGILSALPRPDQPAPPQPTRNLRRSARKCPIFRLTNQDGKRISMKDFRGKALAITFIYAQMPAARILHQDVDEFQRPGQPGKGRRPT